MERVSGVYQLFIKRLPDSIVCLMVSMVVEDFLFAGNNRDIQLFFEHVDRTFTLDAISANTRLRFPGCTVYIEQDDP